MRNPGWQFEIQQFGFPKQKDAKPPMLEDYAFTAIKPEVRLSDRDFDVNNRATTIELIVQIVGL